MGKLRLLIVAAHCDAHDVGESWNAYKWVTELATHCEVTVLTQHRKGRRRASEQMPHVRVIEWEEPGWLSRFERFNAAVKPWYVHFYGRARGQIRRLLASGEQFYVFHQLTPIAIRYPSPCRGWGVPYVIGPLSGGLPTPAEFAGECASASWYMRFRGIDRLRVSYDPLLRQTYEDAAIVLGAAPYVRNLLATVQVQRFEVECEVGIDALAKDRLQRREARDALRLLFVGRAVRTKGLRDAVRAIGRLRDLPHITLVAAGDGEELELCRRESEVLGVADRVELLGRVPREVVEQLYAEADVFLFPSFREPTGGVIIEAMRHGLPIVTSDLGGPGHLVTEDCGLKVPVRNPEQFAADLAVAIRRLAMDRSLLQSLGAGARARVAEIGLWNAKIDRMMKLYRSVLAPVPLPAGAAMCAAAEG